MDSVSFFKLSINPYLEIFQLTLNSKISSSYSLKTTSCFDSPVACRYFQICVWNIYMQAVLVYFCSKDSWIKVTKFAKLHKFLKFSFILFILSTVQCFCGIIITSRHVRPLWKLLHTAQYIDFSSRYLLIPPTLSLLDSSWWPSPAGRRTSPMSWMSFMSPTWWRD